MKCAASAHFRIGEPEDLARSGEARTVPLLAVSESTWLGIRRNGRSGRRFPLQSLSLVGMLRVPLSGTETPYGDATHRSDPHGAVLARHGVDSAGATFPGHPGRIAFYDLFGRHGSEVATIEQDGSDRRQLTPDRATSSIDPTWSADGAKIAYTGHWNGCAQCLFVVDVDGSNWHMVFRPPHTPTFRSYCIQPGRPTARPSRSAPPRPDS